MYKGTDKSSSRVRQWAELLKRFLPSPFHLFVPRAHPHPHLLLQTTHLAAARKARPACGLPVPGHHSKQFKQTCSASTHIHTSNNYSHGSVAPCIKAKYLFVDSPTVAGLMGLGHESLPPKTVCTYVQTNYSPICTWAPFSTSTCEPRGWLIQ